MFDSPSPDHAWKICWGGYLSYKEVVEGSIPSPGTALQWWNWYTQPPQTRPPRAREFESHLQHCTIAPMCQLEEQRA